MKRKLFFVVIFCGLFYVYSDENRILEAINDMFVNTLSNTTWYAGRSSVLFDNNRNKDFYEWKNLQDNDLSTCWAEGKQGSGINEFFLIPFSRKEGLGFSYRKAQSSKNIKCYIIINNGNCINDFCFQQNNRVKECKLQVYDTPVVYGQDKNYVEANPLLIYESIIQMDDTEETQQFDFDINLRNDYLTSSPLLILKLTILEVYPGTEYDNTCISEINVYGEYIKDIEKK